MLEFDGQSTLTGSVTIISSPSTIPPPNHHPHLPSSPPNHHPHLPSSPPNHHPHLPSSPPNHHPHLPSSPPNHHPHLPSSPPNHHPHLPSSPPNHHPHLPSSPPNHHPHLPSSRQRTVAGVRFRVPSGDTALSNFDQKPKKRAPAPELCELSRRWQAPRTGAL